eukprot:10819968-Prorocentrum_lima.AAC.1
MVAVEVCGHWKDRQELAAAMFCSGRKKASLTAARSARHVLEHMLMHILLVIRMPAARRECELH